MVCRRVRPLNVFNESNERLQSGPTHNELDQTVESALSSGGGRLHDLDIGFGSRKKSRKALDHLCIVWKQRADGDNDFLSPFNGSDRHFESERPRHLLQDRMKRCVGMKWVALIPKTRVRDRMELLDHRLKQSGFSNSGLPAHQNNLSIAFLGAPPGVEQDGEFSIAPDDRLPCDAARRKAALATARLENAPRVDLLRETLQGQRRQLFQQEAHLQIVTRRGIDQYGLGWRGRLKSRGKIRG